MTLREILRKAPRARSRSHPYDAAQGRGEAGGFLAALREMVSRAGVRCFWVIAVALGEAMVAEGNDLRWEETEVVVDAGPGQTEVERVFRMQNRGERDIRVTKVSVSCSCTRVSASTNAVAPEAWGEVRAILDLRGRGWEQSKTIAVECDESGGVPYLLRFVVWISAWLVLDSREVPRASSRGWGAWESVWQPVQVER